MLKAWKHLLLTTSFRFKVVPLGEPRYWIAANLHEEAVNKGLMVTMSIRQRIYDIAGFKAATDAQRGSPLSADQVAKMYEKLKLNTKAEPITKSFLERAQEIALHGRNETRACLYKDPWDSVCILSALCERHTGGAKRFLSVCRLGSGVEFRFGGKKLQGFLVRSGIGH